MTQEGQVVELGRPALGEGNDVIDLETRRHVAARHDAMAVPRGKGNSERPLDRPTEGGDSPDVAGLVEHQAKVRIVSEVSGHRHRDRPVAVDLAAFAGSGATAAEGIKVDSYENTASCGPIHDGVLCHTVITVLRCARS